MPRRGRTAPRARDETRHRDPRRRRRKRAVRHHSPSRLPKWGQEGAACAVCILCATRIEAARAPLWIKASRFNGYVVWKMRLIDSQTKSPHTNGPPTPKEDQEATTVASFARLRIVARARRARARLRRPPRACTRRCPPRLPPWARRPPQPARGSWRTSSARSRASTRRRRTRARRPRSGGW